MATLTAFSDVADLLVYCSDATYANARAGTGTLADDGPTSTDVQAGQGESEGVFTCAETLLPFDTSALGALATVSGAVLSLFENSGSSAFSNAGDVEARLHDFGATLTAADFVAGVDLGGKTLLGVVASASWTNNVYNAFSDVAMGANVDKIGTTRIVICWSRHRAGNQPGVAAYEYANFLSADQTGTDNDPKLVITYTLPATAGGGRLARPSSPRSYGYGYGY